MTNDRAARPTVPGCDRSRPRRVFRCWIVLLITVALAAPIRSAPAPAQDQDTSPAVDASIARGLAFLARQQTPEGSFEGGPKLAITGLVLITFLACGHAPDQGKYGLVVRGAEEYLLKNVPADGYLGRVDGSRMYGQGIVTLALAETYGVETDLARRKRIREALEKSLKVILTAQNVAKPDVFAGGWRYEPESGDSDLSLSGWCALALRACQNVGLAVPKEPIGRATQFVLRCYRPERHGFAYQPGGEATAAMTGVGVLNLYLLDASEKREATAAAKLLTEKPVTADERFAYYAHYYVTQAAHQVGSDVWETVWKGTRERLLPEQQSDGGWPQSHTGEEPGRAYATSMALLALSVPYRLLPTYQR